MNYRHKKDLKSPNNKLCSSYTIVYVIPVYKISHYQKV
jgi:hypothetical protein